MIQYYTRITPHGIVPDAPITKSPELLIAEAEKVGMTWREIPGTKIIEFTYQQLKRYIRAQNPQQTSYIGWYATNYKNITNNLLIDAGISIPKGFFVKKGDQPELVEEIFNSLNKPLVIKPNNGSQGQEVFMNVTTIDECKKNVRTCLEYSLDPHSGVMVEEMFSGKEYRVLVSQEKVIAILNRAPANVIGDGHSTIAELIEKKNADPRRFDDPTQALVKIKVDEHVQQHLSSQNITLETIPAINEQVFLRKNSNISTGGDSIDYTDLAHPSVSKIALDCIHAFPGLAIAGIDFMSKDITIEQTPDVYQIIEVNDDPGFSIHDAPYQGESRHAARAFLEILFPELKNN